ncbi:MAG: hypothetical protein CMN05_14625 [Roseibacillus sp.]|nr:hypothetical protein [Roseibacillus sp.]
MAFGVFALTSCGDDESSANSESLNSERPPRPRTEGNRKSSSSGAKSERSIPAPSPDVPEVEDPPAPSKPVVKLDPSIPLPRSAEERAERREARESEEQAERFARIAEQISARMKERDANGDGLLSKEEVSGPFAGGFDEVDTNGDGQLDDAEQAAMIEGLSERMRNFSDRSRRGRGGRPEGDRGSRDR